MRYPCAHAALCAWCEALPSELAHVKDSGPESDLGFQGERLEPLKVLPFRSEVEPPPDIRQALSRRGHAMEMVTTQDTT